MQGYSPIVTYHTDSNTQQSTYSVLTNPISKVPGPWYSKWTDLVARYHYFTGQKVFYVHGLHKRYGMAFHLSNVLHGSG